VGECMVMKRFAVAGLLWIVCLIQAAKAQESYMITRSRWFTQAPAAAPVADAQPFRFRVFLENYGVLVANGTVTLPSGQTRTAQRLGNDLVYTDTAASASALFATYGAGTYTASVSLFGTTLSGSAALGADNYPNTPQLDLSGLQSIDPENDTEIGVNAFAGATEDDYITFVVRNQTGAPVLNDTYSAVGTSVLYLNPGILTEGQAYTAEVAFTRIAGRAPEEAGISLATAFSSVTTFSFTLGGSSPGDTTPPTLTQAIPASGSNLTNRLSGIVFQFSERMDPTRQPVVWSATRNGTDVPLNPALFFILWDSESRFLSCTYNLTGGGWPADVQVRWTLQGGASGFRDTAGNALAEVSGTFNIGSAGGGGNCEGSSPMEVAGFGLYKLLNHLQSGAGTPVDDPENGALVSAFARIPDAPGRAALEFPADPAPLPHQLKFFTGPIAGVEFLTESFETQAALEAAYPPGAYDFQLRNRTNPTVVVSHVVLTLPSSSYPPVPHFANYAAAQNVATNVDFTLSWDAFTGVNTNSDSLQITITDPEGNEVLSLPDACEDKPLPATATSVVVPAGLLSGGVTYTATLNFFRGVDLNRPMPGTGALGMAGVARSTRMTLRTAGGQPPLGPVRFLSSSFDASGNMRLTIECPTGVPLRLQAAGNLNGPFNVNLLTTNATVSPLTVVLPRPEPNYGFVRAIAGE
jgi:hypothetical protein